MAIHEELRAQLKDAMRARDRARLDVIRNVETEAARLRSDLGAGAVLGDEQYRQVIDAYVRRMEKARREFVDAGDAGRAQAEKLAFEIEYLSRWLPESLGEDETRAIVDAAIADLEADDPKMAGRVIGHVMKAGPDGLDGALVGRLVRERLGGS
jgi:uncharacterized protein YqeY